MTHYSRRNFLKTGAGAAALFAGTGRIGSPGTGGPAAVPGGPCIVSSGNGIRATAKAMEMIQAGADPLDAVIAGVNIVEDDPNDMSVGYGGLPNEDGVVELDSSVMYGPTHTAGAVAALRNIKNPSKVARLVMDRTDHVLLVGEGALRFAKAHGFKEEDLLTDKSREAWLRWKETISDKDNWFPPEVREPAREPAPGHEHPRHHQLHRHRRGRPPGRRHDDERPVLEALRDASATRPSSAPASTSTTRSARPVRRGGAKPTCRPAPAIGSSRPWAGA